MTQDFNKPNPQIARLSIWRKLAAFIVTSLTVFLLISLSWPFSVDNYRSVASIEIAKTPSLNSKEQLKPLLSFAVREETKDSRLESALQDTQARTELETQTLSDGKYEEICNAIQIGVNDTGDQFKLRIAFDGSGGTDERQLLNVIADRVAYRISTGRATGELADGLDLAEQIPMGNAPLKGQSELEQAEWLLNQIEGDLGRVDEIIASYLETPGEPSRDESAFKLASTRKINSSVIDEQALEELKQTVSSIDTHGLRTILNSLKSTGVDPNKVALHVRSVEQSQCYPLNGIPDLGSCLLMISLAGLVGSIVAWHYDPFENRGFENLHSISQSLKIPVVAILQSDSSQTKVPEHRWANTSAKLCSLFLLGFTVVVGGFFILSPEIREALLQNPFYGFARIIKVFIG